MRPKTHVFQPDSSATHWDGEQTCVRCTLRRGNKVHDVPPVPVEVAERDARTLGEREEER